LVLKITNHLFIFPPFQHTILWYDFRVSGVLASATLVKMKYWPLIKSRQTFLLTLTGITGYLCQTIPPIDWLRVLGLVGSLLLTISGSTVMNMLIDRDIDRKMTRTSPRPLATGQVGAQPALLLGSTMLIVGLLWSLWLSPLYSAIVFTGAGVNLIVYSLWLKRITAWSILFGGIAGGMPILAGRVLAIGRIDILGILLALIVICWIPSHNLTFNMLYADDYLSAGIPTAVNKYGPGISYAVITVFAFMVAFLAFVTATLLGISGVFSVLILAGSIGMVIFSVNAWISRSKRNNIFLYKYVSIYLLVLMLTFAISGIL
jgi:heme o synthase